MITDKDENEIDFVVKTTVDFDTDGKHVQLQYGNPEENDLPVDVYVDGIKKDLPDYVSPVKVNSIQSNELLVQEVVQNHEMFGILD